MQLSGHELSAIVKLAISVAAADNKFATEEKVMIAREIARFNVPQNKVQYILEEAQEMSGQEAIVVMASLNPEEKKYATAFLGTLIAIDGEITDSEVERWSLISALCDLPTMSIGEAANYMANL